MENDDRLIRGLLIKAATAVYSLHENRHDAFETAQNEVALWNLAVAYLTAELKHETR